MSLIRAPPIQNQRNNGKSVMRNESDQNIAKETVGNKDSRANSGPWEPFGDDKGVEENRDPSDASGPGAQGRDLCPFLPLPFEEVLGAPWVGKTMSSPWKGRTYPRDPWGFPLPFLGPIQAFPVNVNPGAGGGIGRQPGTSGRSMI